MLKAIIPSGGRGTRMRPLTFSANKHLIPIGNKPLIFYPIETIAKLGIKELAITYNPGQLGPVESLLGDGSKWGIKITYILQPEPKGLANIFQVCEEWLAGESFVLHLGDNIFTEGVKSLHDQFVKNKPNGLVGIVHHPENTRLGVPFFDEDGKLVRYVEKPENPPHDFTIPGIYFFDNNVFKCFKGADAIQPSPRGEYEISAAYQWLIDHDYRIETKEVEGRWLDPGKVEDWLEANEYLLDTQAKFDVQSELPKTVKVHGRVSIGKNCRIDDSTIKGPVCIGDNVTIKGSYIGPFTSIYHNCTLIDSHITSSVLMDSVVIDKVKKTIDNSIIGSDTNISQQKNSHNNMELLISELSKINL